MTSDCFSHLHFLMLRHWSLAFSFFSGPHIPDVLRLGSMNGITVDAVYAMAHAVHRMIADVCGPNARELCAELRPAPSGKELLKYIRNVSFIGKYPSVCWSVSKPKMKRPLMSDWLTGTCCCCCCCRSGQYSGPQGQPVRFNKDGDAYGSYSFYQYQRHGGKYDYVRIGDWSAS